MRRSVVALIAVALALTLGACSGGGDKATTETPPATAAPAKPAATEAEAPPDRSANDNDALPMAFPSFTTTTTPAIFKEKLDAGRAMLILFYDTRQDQTTDVRAEVDAVMTEYRGLIDLVTFDVAGAATDPAVQAAALYASELGVASTPYLIVVDKGGFITWRNKGYAERGIIEREVERATK